MGEREGVSIRPAEINDLEAMTHLYNHFVEATSVTFDIETFTTEERESWFAQFNQTGPHQLFLAECEGVLAGYAGSMTHRAKPAYNISVETTIYVGERFARMGIGHRLYQRLFTALEKEDLRSIFAAVTLPNDASIRFHKSHGFTEIGTFHEIGRKFGLYHDVMWFERRI